MWVVYELDDESGEPSKIAGPFDTQEEAEDYQTKSGADGVLALTPPVEGHQQDDAT